jgi:FKBP-type peptidyl-prolyl cis-trans isomerase
LFIRWATGNGEDDNMRMIQAERPVAGWFRRGGRLFGLTGVAFAIVLAGCQKEQAAEGAAQEEGKPAAADAAGFADDSAKAAYSLGYIFTENVKRQFGDEVDVEAFVRGVRDQFSGATAAVDDQEAERVLNALVEQRQAAAMAESSANLDAGLKYLEENAKREGVVTLDSGLQYEVLEPGEGAKPAAEDTVTTHYEGRLIDGTVFDSSYQRGEPATFPLNRVIPGWTEGLQLMSPGAKYRLYVPAVLAYGDRATGTIPPNSTLVFDVELIKVEPADAGEVATPEATQ